jgi:hypothetical protein
LLGAAQQEIRVRYGRDDKGEGSAYLGSCYRGMDRAAGAKMRRLYA